MQRLQVALQVEAEVAVGLDASLDALQQALDAFGPYLASFGLEVPAEMDGQAVGSKTNRSMLRIVCDPREPRSQSPTMKSKIESFMSGRPSWAKSG